MLSLYNFLTEYMVLEGGAAGHMAHPIDYIDFTAEDLKQLVKDIFLGNIEDVTEKIDGTNIQASMNNAGEVVFIRNNGDLNSERGGMSVDDMAIKWKDKPRIANTFMTAGHIIDDVFTKLGSRFFNPDENTRLVVNCECVNAGVTNIVPYNSAMVAFHDIWIYTKIDGKWKVQKVTKNGLDKLEKACEGMDTAKPTPKIIIKTVEESNDLVDKYIKLIDNLFGSDNHKTINDWKKDRFDELLNGKWSWIKTNAEGQQIIFNRWFNGDKKVNLRELKKIYPDNVDDINVIEKSSLYKEVISEIVEPLETIFLNLGNDVIKLCQGLLNGVKNDSVVKQLQQDVKDVVKYIEKDGTPEIQAKLLNQLNRLNRLGGDGSINSTEGIVFKYKGRLMKLTGSFAPLNQILGSIKYSI